MLKLKEVKIGQRFIYRTGRYIMAEGNLPVHLDSGRIITADIKRDRIGEEEVSLLTGDVDTETMLTWVWETLDEAEPTVWRECACIPKRPPDWKCDQWELRPYDKRRSERSRRCAWHLEFDKLLGYPD